MTDILPQRSLHITLPFPVSTNAYWMPIMVRAKSGRMVAMKCRSKKARQYRDAVIAAVRVRFGDAPFPPFAGQVRLDITLRAPDCRSRDLDNHAGKALQDALTQAKIWRDDKQVKEISASWGPNIKRGCANIIITEI